MSFKAGRKGSYYPEGQNEKGGGLCHNPSEVNTSHPCHPAQFLPYPGTLP